ncbi:MAG: hypothetical protein ACP5OE_06220 [Thermodesulfobium sp.]
MIVILSIKENNGCLKMPYIPHERLSISWENNEKSFMLSLPWLSMEIEVMDKDKGWIKDATEHLHSIPANNNVQRFINDLKDYPIFYIQPRTLEEFKGKDLQSCPELTLDSSTPSTLISTFGCEMAEELKESAISSWIWDRKKILSKAQILGTDLYDPISFVSYLICYRLEWESTTWSGQDGFGQFLGNLLKHDETQFFQAIGWVSKQSWYTTKKFSQMTKPALVHFEKARELIHHFICDEAGHYKFMEEVFRDLVLDKNDFPVGEATKWLLRAYKRVAEISPLTFSAMINLFEAAYYEGQDPISRVIKMSSKPQAARGYDLHYKINQEHRHCDMPIHLASYLAPQTYAHTTLVLGLFELTLNLLDQMEKNLKKRLKMY